MFSSGYCEIFKNTFSEEHLWAAASFPARTWKHSKKQPLLDKVFNNILKLSQYFDTEFIKKSKICFWDISFDRHILEIFLAYNKLNLRCKYCVCLKLRPNKGKYGLEQTPYLDTVHAVLMRSGRPEVFYKKVAMNFFFIKVAGLGLHFY